MERNENGLDLTAHIIDFTKYIQTLMIFGAKIQKFLLPLQMTAAFYSLTAH